MRVAREPVHHHHYQQDNPAHLIIPVLTIEVKAAILFHPEGPLNLVRDTLLVRSAQEAADHLLTVADRPARQGAAVVLIPEAEDIPAALLHIAEGAALLPDHPVADLHPVVVPHRVEEDKTCRNIYNLSSF